MSSELSTIDAKRDLIARTIAGPANLTQDEFEVFLYSCEHLGLDPLAKQVYAMKSGGRLQIITSIDGFRVIAHRTGKYAGQVGPEWLVGGKWSEEPHPDHTAARVGVLRKGYDAPVWGVVSRAEFNSNSGTWKKMPAHMLAKVAESHAIRKAFPEHTSGAYTSEEMDGAGVRQDAGESPRKALVVALSRWAGVSPSDADAVKQTWGLFAHKAVEGFDGARIDDTQAAQLLLTVNTLASQGVSFDAYVSNDNVFAVTTRGGTDHAAPIQADASNATDGTTTNATDGVSA